MLKLVGMLNTKLPLLLLLLLLLLLFSKMKVIFLEKYPLPDEKSVVRTIANAIKKNDKIVIKQIGEILAQKLPSGSSLIPIPGSDGTSRNTKNFAMEIATGCNGEVLDILIGPKRESQYSAKKRGKPLLIREIGTRLKEKATIPQGNVFYVDNVIETGNTYMAAVAAVGQEFPIIVYAKVFLENSNQNSNQHRHSPKSKQFQNILV
jgi:hypothetical protein